MSSNDPTTPEGVAGPARDRVYAAPRATIPPFEFNDGVAAVFDDMASRSIPGYSNAVAMASLIAARYGRPGAHGYDLGCSLGATLISMARGGPDSMRWIGVDSSPSMIERCRVRLKESIPDRNWSLRLEDVAETPIENASLVALNFTLQFIALENRADLLGRIAKGLVPGGALILSEKIQFADPKTQEAIGDLHLDFKRAQGYSELEISQKRTALENTLIPETEETHHQRLKEAGFGCSVTWMRSLNFVSILALRTEG